MNHQPFVTREGVLRTQLDFITHFFLSMERIPESKLVYEMFADYVVQLISLTADSTESDKLTDLKEGVGYWTGSLLNLAARYPELYEKPVKRIFQCLEQRGLTCLGTEKLRLTEVGLN